jgi:carboxylesterase type B
VLVWISPGGFQMNSANMFNANYFMDTDVVLVTFDFRLGALGNVVRETGISFIDVCARKISCHGNI